jgi:FMN-dependent NADH-azoreductase
VNGVGDHLLAGPRFAEDQSRSLSLGAEFLEEYHCWNPRDEVQVLDLYRDSIQRVDQDVLNARGRIERGEDYGILSYEERQKMSRIWRLTEQFDRCNKYFFVTHSLNLWFPAEFKMYIDAICIPDRTYCLTPHGAKGTLSAADRKSLHLHAGPPYEFGHEQDLSIAYLSSIFNFFGVTAQETVLLQGDDPERGSQRKYEAVRRKLLEVARRF